MPKENKKRGRRDEKKRKHQDDEEYAANIKRHKTEEENWQQQDEIKLEEAGMGYHDALTSNVQPTQEFYGMLDEDEQAYFKSAARILELNEFVTGSDEERNAFIAGAWKECKDKELKVASSQSCSRFMEKLIQYATPAQLKSLFRSFSGHFTYLVQHRFASHCCEALFQKAAPLVTEELITPFQVINNENREVATSVESLYLGAVAELQGNFGYLMTDAFASHSVRVLLLVLSGRPLATQSTKSLLQSKKKETKIESAKEMDTRSRAVPSSFQAAFDNIIQDMVGHLDSNYLRALATHPLGNPVLQLLLEIEFSTAAKQKQKGSYFLFDKIVPDATLTKDSDSARFIRGLMFDPVGSHLLETIVKNCPGKIFKPIWLLEIQPKLVGMVKNDSAIHIVAQAIERLSPEDLQTTIDSILPELSAMLERKQFSIVRLLIERSAIRKLGTEQIDDAIALYYVSRGVAATILPQLDLDGHAIDHGEAKAISEKKDPSRQRESAFLQTLLDYQGSSEKLILETFSKLKSERLADIGKDKYATFVLQKSLSVGDKVYRRIVVQKLTGAVVDLTLHEAGSHVLDALWKATVDLHFLRERIAQKLADAEVQVRESYNGRFVWRSWMMDIYTRKKQSWIEKSKQADHVVEENQVKNLVMKLEPLRKNGIEAARERFAARKASQKHSTGANSIRLPRSTAVI